MTQHIEHDEWAAAVYRELARSGPATLPVTTEERLRATITALANECDRALDLVAQLRLERDAAHAECAALPQPHWTATP